MKFFSKTKIEQIKTESKKQKKYTLLLVDDEAANLRFLSGLLEKEYNILTATDGQEALDLIMKDPDPQRIDLIITDQRMPKMTGVEFLTEIMPTIPNTVRMILTGFTDVEAVIEAINQSKVYKFLTKPIDGNDLTITIQRALEAYDLEHTNNILVKELKDLNTSLEMKVEQRTSQLKEANEALKSMTEMIVHDLKNPLSNVLMFSKHIISKELSTERNKEIANLIKTSGEKMFNMIDSLLDIAKIEQGITDLDITTLNPDVTLNQVINEFKGIADSKKISIEFNNSNEKIAVLADPMRLQQVLENLISNAIKFSQPEKSIIISLTKEKNDIIFMIKDQGPGLTEEDKGKLFQKFSRLSAAPTGGEHSSRVGLSIAKNLIDAMNGNIWCVSQYGQGASFYFSLPIGSVNLSLPEKKEQGIKLDGK